MQRTKSTKINTRNISKRRLSFNINTNNEIKFNHLINNRYFVCFKCKDISKVSLS